MRTREAALLMICSLAIACGWAPAANADVTGVPGAPVFGISEPQAWRTYPVHASPEEIAGLVKDIGASSHEFWVHWDAVEPAAPVDGVHSYDFEAFDRMYEADLARGIKPLITVQSAPRWAWKEGVTYAWLPEHPPSAAHYADWRAFLTELVRRYPQAIGIQIWNEPNLRYFWGLGDPADPTDPDAYTALLEQAYGAIKSADPSMPVIGGALSNNETTADGQISMLQFAERMLADGAARYMDGLSVHPYPDTADLSHFLVPLDQLRSLMALHGVSRPLWITEVGKTTTGPQAVSEDRQAAVLVDIYRRIRQMPDVAAFYVHSLTEPTQNDADPEKGYGLVRGQGVGSSFPPKPAFTALAQEAASPSPPPTEEPVLLISGRPVQRPLARHGVSIVETCVHRDCTASAAGTVRIHRRNGTVGTAKLGPAVRALPADQSTPVKLRLRARVATRIEHALSAGWSVRARIHGTVDGASVGDAPQTGPIRIVG